MADPMTSGPVAPPNRTRVIIGAAALTLIVVVGLVVLLFSGDHDDEDHAAGEDTIATTTTERTKPSVQTTVITTSTLPSSPPSTAAMRPNPDLVASSPLGDHPTLASAGPSGSGCTPGPGPLPDGWWYGLPTSAPRAGSSFEFDLACYYSGDAAHEMASQAGEEDGAPNDYWVVNDNPTERSVDLTADAELVCIDMEAPGGITEAPCEAPPGESGFAIWVRIDDGQATKVLEQYAP